MESTKNIELWNDCFDSMAENEYESKSLGELEDIYKDWLQERSLKCKETEIKASAYDRLMSGGKKTLKELANILGKPVAIDIENRLWWFPKKPEIGLTTWIWYDNQFGCFGEELPNGLINFNGEWEDSLTLPDGWEEKQ